MEADAAIAVARSGQHGPGEIVDGDHVALGHHAVHADAVLPAAGSPPGCGPSAIASGFVQGLGQRAVDLPEKAIAFSEANVAAATLEANTDRPGTSREAGTAITWSGWACVTTAWRTYPGRRPVAGTALQ